MIEKKIQKSEHDEKPKNLDFGLDWENGRKNDKKRPREKVKSRDRKKLPLDLKKCDCDKENLHRNLENMYFDQEITTLIFQKCPPIILKISPRP